MARRMPVSPASVPASSPSFDRKVTVKRPITLLVCIAFFSVLAHAEPLNGSGSTFAAELYTQ